MCWCASSALQRMCAVWACTRRHPNTHRHTHTRARRSPGRSAPHCWAAFLGTYQEAWSRRHPPLALVPHPGSSGAWVAAVRGGGMLSMLRPAAPLEALAAPEGLAGVHDPAALAAGVLPSGPLRTVHKAAAEVANLLGPLALDAFVGLLTAGADPQSQLVPVLSALVMEGPGGAGVGASGAVDDVAREAHVGWRHRRRQALLRLGQAMGGLQDPVEAIRCACVMVVLGLLGVRDCTRLARLA